MRSVIGVDPGPEKSAYVQWDNKTILEKDICPNEKLCVFLETWGNCYESTEGNVILAVESMNHITNGGRAIIDTLLWAGQFYHAWHGGKAFIERYKITLTLTGKNPSKEADKLVRASLITRFGPPGTKKNPNPITYGLHSHLWAAFAVAVVHFDHLAFQAREMK